MTKTLFTLCITINGDSHPLHFDDYETLLASRAALVDAAIPGLTFEEDTTTKQVFLSTDTALAHARLWVASLKGTAAPGTIAALVAGPETVAAPVKRKPGRRAAGAPETGKPRADEIMAMLTRKGGVSLDEVVAAMGIKPNSASALISVATRKRGYVAKLEGGRYTATLKPKARTSRTAKSAAASRDSRPQVH